MVGRRVCRAFDKRDAADAVGLPREQRRRIADRS
jgi:hypothetical protein